MLAISCGIVNKLAIIPIVSFLTQIVIYMSSMTIVLMIPSQPQTVMWWKCVSGNRHIRESLLYIRCGLDGKLHVCNAVIDYKIVTGREWKTVAEESFGSAECFSCFEIMN